MRTVVSQSAQWLMTARTHCSGGSKFFFEFPKCSNFKPDCTWCYTGSDQYRAKVEVRTSVVESVYYPVGALHELVLPYQWHTHACMEWSPEYPHHHTKWPLALARAGIWILKHHHTVQLLVAAACLIIPIVNVSAAHAILKSKSVLEIFFNSDDGYSLVKAIAAE